MINLDENPWNDITSEGNEAYTGVHAYKVNKYISTPDEELEKEIEIRKLTDNKKLYKYKEEKKMGNTQTDYFFRGRVGDN